LLLNPKLRIHARNFAAICAASIDAVPTLADFRGGKNIPVIGSQTITQPTTPTKPSGYIAAFPVVDALSFSAASKHVGDRVELVGKIVEVKFGLTSRGRRPYLFINFGDWRQNIVKISIWSDGLGRLSERPSKSWVGRWVTVTGLIDPPYTSPKHRYTHLSITVEQDGQIQQLTQAEAEFRLASIGKPPMQRNRVIVEKIVNGQAPTPPQLTSKLRFSWARNNSKTTSPHHNHSEPKDRRSDQETGKFHVYRSPTKEHFERSPANDYF
jgi:hypothetical protein